MSRQKKKYYVYVNNLKCVRELNNALNQLEVVNNQVVARVRKGCVDRETDLLEMT